MTAAGALAALTAVTGCDGVSNGLACTDVGAVSGVTVDITAQPSTTYRLCAGSACDTHDTTTADPQDPLMLQAVLPDSVGPTGISVRFTGTPKGAARPAVDETTRVTLRKSQPNGAHCDPTVYQASLAWSASRGLRLR